MQEITIPPVSKGQDVKVYILMEHRINQQKEVKLPWLISIQVAGRREENTLQQGVFTTEQKKLGQHELTLRIAHHIKRALQAKGAGNTSFFLNTRFRSFEQQSQLLGLGEVVFTSLWRIPKDQPAKNQIQHLTRLFDAEVRRLGLDLRPDLTPIGSLHYLYHDQQAGQVSLTCKTVNPFMGDNQNVHLPLEREAILKSAFDHLGYILESDEMQYRRKKHRQATKYRKISDVTPPPLEEQVDAMALLQALTSIKDQLNTHLDLLLKAEHKTKLSLTLYEGDHEKYVLVSHISKPESGRENKRNDT